jgi:HD-like signal output (HDOD) protein
VSLSTILDNPRLPTPPAVALQVVEKASQSECDLEELIALLRQDSGLCARVLKTVNSGLFGLPRAVGSLKQAVVMLGARPLRSLVLSVSLPAVQISEPDELIRRYWQESATGAVLARQLAIHLRHPEPEDDLVAGLLRDLGILVLREAFPNEYRAVWESALSDRAPLCQREYEVFGMDHTEVGAGLLQEWHLPPEIFLPVRYHHTPNGLGETSRTIDQRTRLLHFASGLAALGGTSADDVGGLLGLAREDFGMDGPALTEFLDSVAPSIREFADILNIKIGSLPNFAAILTAGSEELVRLSVEASRSQIAPAPGAAQPARPPSEEMFAETTFVPVRRSAPEAVLSVKPTARQDALPDFDVGFLYSAHLGTGFRLSNYYEVRAEIGRGGMGIVFKGYDPLLDRFVAIKMLTPERLASAAARERFAREAKTSASIQHENVVVIHAVSDVNGLPYIVMEYVAGSSLQDLLVKGGPLPIPDVIRYGRQIAAGLHAAHLRRVIHRDIKPANILVSESSGNIKITDFGLARVLDQPGLSQQGTLAGTPQFMSPEQFMSGNLDHRSDLFSLGSILYNLCAGSPPFSGESIIVLMDRICRGAPAPIRQRRAGVPNWLEEIINRLLQKAPEDRFESGAQVVEAFERQGRVGA